MFACLHVLLYITHFCCIALTELYEVLSHTLRANRHTFCRIPCTFAGQRSVSIVVQPTSVYHSIYDDCLCRPPRIRLSSKSSSSISDNVRLSSAAVSRSASSVADCHQHCTDDRCSRQCCVVNEITDKTFAANGEMNDRSTTIPIQHLTFVSDQYVRPSEGHYVRSPSEYRVKPEDCRIDITPSDDNRCGSLMVKCFI